MPMCSDLLCGRDLHSNPAYDFPFHHREWRCGERFEVPCSFSFSVPRAWYSSGPTEGSETNHCAVILWYRTQDGILLLSLSAVFYHWLKMGISCVLSWDWIPHLATATNIHASTVSSLQHVCPHQHLFLTCLNTFHKVITMSDLSVLILKRQPTYHFQKTSLGA